MKTKDNAFQMINSTRAINQAKEMVKLYMTSESELQGPKITDVFSEESNQTSGLTGLVCLLFFENGILSD